MRKCSDLLRCALCILIVFGFSVLEKLQAGGPVTVGPGGKVFKWNPANPDTFPVRYSIDSGPLGSLTNQQATDLIRQAFEKWEQVDTSSIQFREEPHLGTDISADCPSPNCYSSFFDNQERPENPIVLDSDGMIIEDVLGEGSSQTVLGFAGVRSIAEGEYRSAWVVLNGLVASQFGSFPNAVTMKLATSSDWTIPRSIGLPPFDRLSRRMPSSFH